MLRRHRPNCDIISFNVLRHDLFRGHIRSFSAQSEVREKITIFGNIAFLGTLMVSPNSLHTNLSCTMHRYPKNALVIEVQYFDLHFPSDQDGIGISKIVVLSGLP